MVNLPCFDAVYGAPAAPSRRGPPPTRSFAAAGPVETAPGLSRTRAIASAIRARPGRASATPTSSASTADSTGPGLNVRSIREHGGKPSSRLIDELPEERLGHRSRPGEDAEVDT
jgi:hypothetical protein